MPLLISLIICLTLCLCIVPVSAESSFIVIHNITELQNIKNNPDSNYILANDIDCTGTNFKPLPKFTGILDGNGYNILNLTSSGDKYENAGLFDFVSGAIVKNLKLVDVNFQGSIAGMVAYATDSTFDNCDIQGSINGNYFSGSIAGILNKSVITHCSSECTLTGTNDVGGLAGFANLTTISESSFTGQIKSGAYTGGCIGFLSSGTVERCYIEGDITGSSQAGGIVGNNGGLIKDSYFIGELSPLTNLSMVGGLAGSNSGNIDMCYAIPTFNDINSYSGGLIGDNYASIEYSYCGTENPTSFSLVGYGNKYLKIFVSPSQTIEIESGSGTMTGCEIMSTSALKIKSTFVSWDFSQIWEISPEINNGYPVLLP